MREIISVIAGLIAIGGMVPYIIDTIKGKTKPNLVSWFTWTILTSIGAAAAFSEGAVTTAIFSAASAFSTFLVVVLGLRNGIKHYTRFDVICQMMALIGIILWRVTNDAAIAVAVVVITDFIAALPTIRHSWRDPHAETASAFAAAAFGAALTLFTITQFSFVALAYPIYLTLANIFAVAVLLYRRPRVKEKK